MIGYNSAIADVIEGLKRADCPACNEFYRRQSESNKAALLQGAALLGNIAFNLQCDQPEVLVSWKSPESNTPFESLPQALEAASSGREADAHALLHGVPFEALAVTASACGFIGMAGR